MPLLHPTKLQTKRGSSQKIHPHKPSMRGPLSLIYVKEDLYYVIYMPYMVSVTSQTPYCYSKMEKL